MRNLKLLRITHFLTLLVVITICNSCFEIKTDFKSEFIKNLTNDSIGYWDYWPDEFKYGVKDRPIYTYGFNQKGTLEYYCMRHDLMLSEETDKTGKYIYFQVMDIFNQRILILLNLNTEE